MERLLQSVKIAINEKVFVKDPESSDLGKRIIKQSIVMIDKMGFESFTFKKLGNEIGSNESSIYRYFENKHKLLVYLTSWYWGWVEYQLVFMTTSISDPIVKFQKAIEIISKPVEEDSNFTHVNEVILHRIVINESSKSFLTKEVDLENKDGYFVIYKRMVNRLSEMISGIDDSYSYPNSLASTILEGVLHQNFLKNHFHSITDFEKGENPSQFFSELALSALKTS